MKFKLLGMGLFMCAFSAFGLIRQTLVIPMEEERVSYTEAYTELLVSCRLAGKERGAIKTVLDVAHYDVLRDRGTRAKFRIKALCVLN